MGLKIAAVSLAVWGCLGLAPLFAQITFKAVGEGPNLIQQKLGTEAGVGFRMGWAASDGKLLVDEQIPSVYVYAGSSSVLTGKLLGAVEVGEIQKIRRLYCVACATDPTYYQYQLDKPETKAGQRVLVSPSPLPDTVLGFQEIKVNHFFLKKAAGILGADPSLLHRSLYLRTPDGKFTYSFHAFYDRKSNVLKSSGVILEKRGVLLAKDTSVFEAQTTCKDCATPNYADPLDKVFSPVNLLQTASLPCPIVILNNYTPEGRALSLLTFDLEGAKSEMRAYETLLNCCK